MKLNLCIPSLLVIQLTSFTRDVGASNFNNLNLDNNRKRNLNLQGESTLNLESLLWNLTPNKANFFGKNDTFEISNGISVFPQKKRVYLFPKPTDESVVINGNKWQIYRREGKLDDWFKNVIDLGTKKWGYKFPHNTVVPGIEVDEKKSTACMLNDFKKGICNTLLLVDLSNKCKQHHDQCEIKISNGKRSDLVTFDEFSLNKFLFFSSIILCCACWGGISFCVILFYKKQDILNRGNGIINIDSSSVSFESPTQLNNQSAADNTNSLRTNQARRLSNNSSYFNPYRSQEDSQVLRTNHGIQGIEMAQESIQSQEGSQVLRTNHGIQGIEMAQESIQSQEDNQALRRNQRAQSINETSVSSWTNHECVICLGSFEINQEVVTLPCDPNHTFHKNCYAQLLDESCPTCRQGYSRTGITEHLVTQEDINKHNISREESENAHRQELIAQGVNVQSLSTGEVVINV